MWYRSVLSDGRGGGGGGASLEADRCEEFGTYGAKIKGIVHESGLSLKSFSPKVQEIKFVWYAIKEVWKMFV